MPRDLPPPVPAAWDLLSGWRRAVRCIPEFLDNVFSFKLDKANTVIANVTQ